MDALTVEIIIIVGCVVFKIISWILICRNSSEEKKRLKARQNLKPFRSERRARELLTITGVDVEKQPTRPHQDAADHQTEAATAASSATTATKTTNGTPAPKTTEAPATVVTVTEAPSTKKDSPGGDADAPDSPDSTPEEKNPTSSCPKSGSGSGVVTAGPGVGIAGSSEVVSAAVAGSVAASVLAAVESPPEVGKDQNREKKEQVSEEPKPVSLLPPHTPVPDLNKASGHPDDSDTKTLPDLNPQPDPQPRSDVLEPSSQSDPLPNDPDLPSHLGPSLEPPPPVTVPSIGGAGITALGINGSEPPTGDTAKQPVRPERKKKKKKLTSLKTPASGVAAAQPRSSEPVSDFDDYHSMHFKHLPPKDSSPPPAQYNTPQGAPSVPPPRTSVRTVMDRRKMEKKLRDQEGMDF